MSRKARPRVVSFKQKASRPLFLPKVHHHETRPNSLRGSVKKGGLLHAALSSSVEKRKLVTAELTSKIGVSARSTPTRVVFSALFASAIENGASL
jgi:hypothetical protein